MVSTGRRFVTRTIVSIGILSLLSVLVVVGTFLTIHNDVQKRRAKYAVPQNADVQSLLRTARQLHVGPISDPWELRQTRGALDEVISQLKASDSASDIALYESLDIRYFYQALAMNMGELAATRESITDLYHGVARSIDFRNQVTDDNTATLSLILQVLGKQTTDKAAALQQVEQIEAAVEGRLTPSDELQFTKVIQGTRNRLNLLGTVIQLRGETSEGETVDIENLRGRIVLIECWSTSCVHCIQEMPSLKEVYQEFRNQGFEIIGLPLDPYPGQLLAFVEDQQIAWPQIGDYSENRQRIEEWGIRSIPSSLLIDRQGRVVALDVRVHSTDPNQHLRTRLRQMLSDG